jgi:tetratricopeptide (TPR) repeat protein
VAIIVRLIHVSQMHGTVFFATLMGDARGYDAWARQIAAGDWVGRDVFYQAPLYPYFLAAVYAVVGHDLLAVRVLQAALGAASCVALGLAASRLLGASGGLVAGLMLALYPPAIFFDGLIQKSVLDVLFVCLALALAMRMIAVGATSRGWFSLGLTLGVLSLTRENALALVVVVLAWALITRTSKLGRLTPAMLVLAGLALVLAPVVARNYVVGGGFYLTTSQFGSNLFIGNNAQADGSYASLRMGRGSPEFERLDATTLAEEGSGRRLTPGEVSRYWTDRTLQFMAAQPRAWVQLMARKIWLLSNADEIVDTESQESHEGYSIVLRVLARIWHFGVLAPLAAAGMVVLWPRRPRLWPVYAMAGAYAASVVLFFVVARYRLPLVPFAVLFASACLVDGRAFLTQSRRRLIAVVGVAALVAVASNWPLYSADASRAITENNLGTALQEDGHPEAAVHHYTRALTFDPDYSPALNNLGSALRAAGRVDEAVAMFERALAQGGDAASLHFNLGNALMARGDTAGAVEQYRRAVSASPSSIEAHNNLGRAFESAGLMDEAIAAFRRAVAIDERSAMAHANLGNALATAGAWPEAVAALRRASALEPANAATLYDLGSVLLEAGDPAGGAEALGRSLRLRPNSAAAHNNLGIALAAQGRLADAITHWEEAMRLDPGFSDARKNLEKARE